MSNETAVTVIENAAVGSLPVSVQQALEMRKMQNQVAGQLASMNWGKQIDLPTRRAIADWGARYGVDTATEIHVLGGNIYLNSAYYLRRLGQMIAAGVVEYAYADHVEEDERLAKLGTDGELEVSRRLMERIKHGVPDKAQSAVVFRIKLRNLEREVVGVKWCGGGTRKGDPVGDAFPVESAESRAARRAMRQIVTHLPQFADEIEQVEASAVTVSAKVQQSEAEFLAGETKARELLPPRGRQIPAGGYEYDAAERAPGIPRREATDPSTGTGAAASAVDTEDAYGLALDDHRPKSPNAQERE